jgi:DNA sulfur modification protein DndD
MKLKSISLRNYRQYKDTQIVFADPEEGKPFTVIEGANGTGKTNILNSITWCLYEREAHLGKKYQGLPIINTVTLSQLKPHQVATIEVQIKAENDEGNPEVFRRTQDVSKTNQGDPEYGRSELRVSYRHGRDWERSKDPEWRVRSLVPEAIQEYFFFDGERLDTYFARASKDRIKKEVFTISQLELFNSVIEHLDKRKVEYTRELRDINPKAETVIEEIQRKKQEREERQKGLQDLEHQIDEAKDLENDLSERLRKLPIRRGELERLQDRRTYCDNRLMSLEREIAELKQENLQYLLSSANIIIAFPHIRNTRKLLEQKLERGEIPPQYKKEFIQGLLERECCICGSDISHGEARSRIEKLMIECSELSELSQELIEEKVKLSNLTERAKKFRQGQQRFGREIRRKEEEYQRAEEELREIEQKVKGIDDEEVQRLEREYGTVRRKKEELLQQSGMIGQIIKDIDDRIQSLTSQYQREIKKIEKHGGVKKRILFCEECAEAANEIMTEVMEEIRAEIEAKTKEQFMAIIWKKESYRDVFVDENYEISVLDQTGTEAIGTLSAGERQVLALSFTAALNMVSGFNLPIIIDTPLGRISREPKLNIAMGLPKYMEGKQIVLLVTDEEYSKEVRDALRGYLGKEYRIKFFETEDGNRAEVSTYEEGAR